MNATQSSPPAPRTDTDASPREEPKGGGGTLKQLFTAIAVVIGVIVVTTAFFVALALHTPNAAETLGAIRDVFIIILAWFSVFICISIVILVLQVAALFNLIKNEMVPILETFQKTTDTVRGTSAFVSKNLTQPVIRATGFFAYVRTFLRYLHIIRSAELKEDFVAMPTAHDTAGEENKS